ncbi:hypothetical protein [Paenibacillus sp. MMS18-CY102]|uniref:hypothetical protein n=1 Tax=Paenibacillus sp. MMS18-CY102 TaxID=2682849 RepID=UPI001365B35B|nr:hypothetical protein [Paenibacillus sp. MMS18-CY102]MWC26652.1 hypothetical protein [Paenibacillus sp. MMS18-CY102]
MQTASNVVQVDEEIEVEIIAGKFRWKDRLDLVNILAGECADNGNRFEPAFRSVRLSEYAYYASKMPAKQKAKLKREVLQQAKDIRHLRDSANIGDVVRVPKLNKHPLLNCYVRDGLKLVEAVIIDKTMVSQTHRYTVKRITDGEEQTGNGHMIKSIVTRSSDVSG